MNCSPRLGDEANTPREFGSRGWQAEHGQEPVTGKYSPKQTLGVLNMSQFISSAGLLLDVAGVAVLFVYGPPQPDFQEDDVVVVGNADQQVAAKTLKRKYKCRSRIGLSLLVTGFLLQLIGVWC